MKKYHHTAICENGKIYNFYCEKFPNGSYNLMTMERHEIKDKNYIDWYNKNCK